MGNPNANILNSLIIVLWFLLLELGIGWDFKNKKMVQDFSQMGKRWWPTFLSLSRFIWCGHAFDITALLSLRSTLIPWGVLVFVWRWILLRTPVTVVLTSMKKQVSDEQNCIPAFQTSEQGHKPLCCIHQWMNT